MDKRKEYPDYIIKRIRLSKTKTVFFFGETIWHLIIAKELRMDFLAELFKYRGVDGRIGFLVKDDDLMKLFEIKTKDVKVKGTRSRFGILINIPDQLPPLNVRAHEGILSFQLRCAGKLGYSSQKRKK